MARLRDVPRVLRTVGPIAFVRRVVYQISDDNLLTWAAAMAYSWLFALFPFLIFLLGLLPLLPFQARNAIAGAVQEQLTENLPGPAGDAVRETIEPLIGATIDDGQDDRADDRIETPDGELAFGKIISQDEEEVVVASDFLGGRRTFDAAEVQVTPGEVFDETSIETKVVRNWSGLLSLGVLLTIFAASGGMNMTMSALDRCYDIQKPRPFYKQRLIAIGLTLTVGTMVLFVLVLLPVSGWLLRLFSGALFELDWFTSFLLNVARWTLGLATLFLILGVTYHFGPSLKRRFHLITPGAVFTIIGWLLTGWLFNTYVTSFGGSENYAKTYGAVGGIVILLLLFYVDALILMIGAEINSEMDFALLGVPRKSDDAPEEVATAEKPEAEKDAEDKELEQELRDATQPDPDEKPDGSGQL
jgi:membrane protein